VKHRIRSVIILLLAMALLFAMPTVAVGCRRTPNPFTMEYHIQSTFESMEQFIARDDNNFEDFQIHPIYNTDGTFSQYLLVEFKPIGFMYLRVLASSNITGCTGPVYWDYVRPAVMRAFNRASHFYGIENQDRYFIFVERRTFYPIYDRVIPAIRQGYNFLNLISNELFDEDSLETQIYIRLNLQG